MSGLFDGKPGDVSYTLQAAQSTTPPQSSPSLSRHHSEDQALLPLPLLEHRRASTQSTAPLYIDEHGKRTSQKHGYVLSGVVHCTEVQVLPCAAWHGVVGLSRPLFVWICT